MNNFHVPNALGTAFRDAGRMLIATHVNPDGDAVGSASAMAHICLALGAEARILLMAGLPDFLSWLHLPVTAVDSLGALGDWRPDTLIVVDCGDEHRAGPEVEPLLLQGDNLSLDWRNIRIINVDHHVSNTAYGHVSWVEPQASATAELVGLFAESLGLPLSGDLGEAVYLGLASDTGNFTYSNTGAGCLAMASRIVAQGLNIAVFTDNYENTWTLERMHLWGELFSEVTLHANGVIACGVARRAQLDALGLGNDDLEGFASWLRRIRGARIGLFVREDGLGLSKISLRSMGDFDVQAVCAVFGGGGHAAAAGAEIRLPPDNATAAVLAELERRLR